MTQPIKVMTVFGTRPEAIKMAPIVLEMKQKKAQFTPITVVTAQHREMLDQVLEIFQITPDYDLNIMQPNQTLAQITSRVLTNLDAVIDQAAPDVILVHGDTTTTFAASVSAFYHEVPIGHVEAGLRTWDKYFPYPEEMNRQMTDVLSDFYFAPTTLSRENLLKENHPDSHIFITGNTAIDALQQTISKNYQHAVLDTIDSDHKLLLMTMHRRENQGAPMQRVFRAIKKVVLEHPDTELVYPVHLSPKVREIAKQELGDVARIHLIDPLDVVDFHNLAARSYLILTDSGGVQEEAPSLGKPVLVLRDETERPEGVTAGTLKLVGTDPSKVSQTLTQLLTDEQAYQQMADAKNPYGDGHAAERILEAIFEHRDRL